MAGLKLNAPFIGVGDYFAVQGIYTQGALRYIFQNPNNNWWIQNGTFTLPTASSLMASMVAPALMGPAPAS